MMVITIADLERMISKSMGGRPVEIKTTFYPKESPISGRAEVFIEVKGSDKKVSVLTRTYSQGNPVENLIQDFIQTEFSRIHMTLMMVDK